MKTFNANMWEFHAKVLLNEINSRFANHGKRDKIFSKLENSPKKLDVHFRVTTIGKITFASLYADINVNHILTKLENLDVEVQAYYNYWNIDMQKVEITEATKVVEVKILLAISISFSYCSFFILFYFSFHI